MWNKVSEFRDLAAHRDAWGEFASRIHYIRGDLGTVDGMGALKRGIQALDGGDDGVDGDNGRDDSYNGHDGDDVPSNMLFYLSIAPWLFEPALRNMSAQGLTDETTGWRRVVIEKPFGYDLKSAVALDNLIGQVFDENQVYRIDHYLGKHMVQNLLVFRFANAIFEPIWNRNYIDNVRITVAETITVEDRGSYYDASGVVRDMVQNHLLQLLALVAMEPPNTADSEALRNKKVEVLHAIRREDGHMMARHAVRGQYRGYRDEQGVPSDSITPTYAALRLNVDNWRWRDVPFYLRTGKALTDKISEIVIEFQKPPHSLFPLPFHAEIPSNLLRITLQPDEGILLGIQTKTPDTDMGSMERTNLAFNYRSAFQNVSIPEDYERLLQDALLGDASLFIRKDHIEEAWKIVDPLIDAWTEIDAPPLYMYEQGSWGPYAADDLLARDGRNWLRRE